MPKVHTCLWFDSQAEEAANLYVSLVPNSKVLSIQRNGPGGPGPEGQALTVEFELYGHRVTGLNGGPVFQQTEAASLVLDCDGQAEVDRYWDGLLAGGGTPSQCGWLKDRFGVSWQVIPRQLYECIGGPDPAGRGRAMQAMLQMVKLDVAKLQAAYAGG
jgi:predicted 3-demethylubiquinone-9 3-methyltransferase (glyoxalase superfamily)